MKWFRKQFLFLFSFLFKIPAISSQQIVSNINVSTVLLFFLLFFFLSFFFALKQSSFTNLLLMKQNHFSFSFSFLNTYNSISRKNRRKNSLSCTYLWQGLIFRLLSFTGEWHPQNLAECAFLLSPVQRFYSTLFTGDFLGAWLNCYLSLANVGQELNVLFQISANEKDGVWSMGQSFGFFLLPSFHPVMIFEFFFCPTNYRPWSAGSLWPSFSSCFSGQSLGPVDSNTVG